MTVDFFIFTYNFAVIAPLILCTINYAENSATTNSFIPTNSVFTCIKSLLN